MSWYRVDLLSGGSRFIETKLDLDDFCNAVDDGKCISISKHVIGVPVPGKGPDDMSMTFVTMDKVSPLVAASHSKKEHFNLRQVLTFGIIDTDSNLWKVVRQSALGEAVIATPGKGLVI